MIYVKKNKSFYVSGHPVVTLNLDEMHRLEIFVSKVRFQTKPKVNNVFVSWTGCLMLSGAVSTQFCSLWRKIEILNKMDKNVSCNILQKSASTGVLDVKDKWKSVLADLIAHSDDTAEKQYYIRKRQLSAAAGLSSLRVAMFKETGLTLSQTIAKSSTALVPDLFNCLQRRYPEEVIPKK